MAIPLDRIAAEARQVRPGRLFLTLLAAPLYGLGWVAGTLFLAAAWAGLSVKAGWADARRTRAGAG